jgi:DNA-binding NarL/FixJ family response regulator
MENLPQKNTNNTCPLTLCEREILQIARDNGTIKDQPIAELLSKAPKTVEHHFENIRQKLGVIERYKAICIAEEAGWIALKPRTITWSGGGVNERLPFYALLLFRQCFLTAP